MPSIRAAALTDIGRVRRENEDRLVCDQTLGLFGVADGVGGLPGGAEAAELAIEEVTAGVKAAGAESEPNLAAIVQKTNTAVANLGLRMSPAMGIGSTLTVGLIRGAVLKIAHVGDSRCYMVRNRELMRLTEDHSVENEARMRRARGEVVFYHEANRQALTRCIGQPTRVEVDVITRQLVAGDRYLFCTDGVTRMVNDNELAALIHKHDQPEAGLKEIITLAVTRGGPDNATAVLIHVDQS